MDLQLTGKWVLITGASAGIGASAAKLFAREGVNLILTGRRAEALDALANEIIEAGGAPPVTIAGVLDNQDGCDAITAAALDSAGGTIDILINNAGASHPMDDIWDEEHWTKSYQLNFAAARQVTAALAPGMQAQNWGRIINTTGAMVSPAPNAAMAAKAGLQSWSRSLSMQLAGHGITVNTIAPGRINSDQIRNNLYPTEESRKAFIDAYIPAGYFGEPEDLAVLMVFLASPLARYINGAAIPVDGAMLRFG
jgi:3-oxoacyl-[acyl-carrier protein] reductase